MEFSSLSSLHFSTDQGEFKIRGSQHSTYRAVGGSVKQIDVKMDCEFVVASTIQ